MPGRHEECRGGQPIDDAKRCSCLDHGLERVVCDWLCGFVGSEGGDLPAASAAPRRWTRSNAPVTPTANLTALRPSDQ